MYNDKEKVKDEEEVNENSELSGFKRGDTMVLIGDYADDSDYAFYMNLDSNGTEGTEEAREVEEAEVVKESAETTKNEPILVDEVKKKNKKNKKNKGKRKGLTKFLAVLIFILVAISGLITYRLIETKNFPEGTVLNGVNVSKLKPDKAGLKLEEELNNITLIKDGKNLGKVDTLYKFKTKKAMKKALRKSAVSPYYMYKRFKSESVSIPLKVTSGIEQTVPNLLNLDVDNSKVDQTKDAYIDLDKGEIVPEHQGVNVDYKEVSTKIAKQHYDNPSKLTYKFKSSEFYAKPKIKEGDLADELDFVKKNIMQGLDVETPRGTDIHISGKDLAKIIKYSKKGPTYSKEGADEVAKIVIDKFDSQKDEITINTTKGERTVINYDFVSKADEKKTAESIYKAAKEKTKAKIETSSGNKFDVNNRVEIDLSNQTMTLVIGGETSGSWPIVTGGPGYRTPPGLFALAYKSSPATLRGTNSDGSKYASHVNYWMPFNGGIGIHDADGWRSAYGGSIYVNGGSHGCINAPSAAARTVYNNISAGTAILVHY